MAWYKKTRLFHFYRPSNLPVEGATSGRKSPRPYTSYELKSLRDQLKDNDDKLDIFRVPRPVGGAYTMVDPLRNNCRNKNMVNMVKFRLK